MSFSNTTVSNSYVGDGLDTTFPFTFFFLEGENQIGVKVYDITTTPETEVVPTPAFSIDEDTKIVTFTTAPTVDQRVVIYRLSATTQETEYNDYRFPFDTAERSFDRAMLLLQEHDKMLETSGLKEYFNPNGNDPVAPSTGSGLTLVAHTTGTLDAASGNLVYLTNPTNTVTINLPASPTEGDEVIVKEASGLIANKTVDANGSTIVGVGATYALQSIYESTRFIYSSAGWLIV